MLNGVNKLCARCKEICKQFKQISIIHCPNHRKLAKEIAKSPKAHLGPTRKSSNLASERGVLSNLAVTC